MNIHECRICGVKADGGVEKEGGGGGEGGGGEAHAIDVGVGESQEGMLIVSPWGLLTTARKTPPASSLSLPIVVAPTLTQTSGVPQSFRLQTLSCPSRCPLCRLCSHPHSPHIDPHKFNMASRLGSRHSLLCTSSSPCKVSTLAPYRPAQVQHGL